MKRKDEHLAQKQQTERTIHVEREQPQPCCDSTFSESCYADWKKNVPQWLLTILCSQIVHILLNSLTALLTSWSQIIPLQEMTVFSDSFSQAASQLPQESSSPAGTGHSKGKAVQWAGLQDMPVGWATPPSFLPSPNSHSQLSKARAHFTALILHQ